MQGTESADYSPGFVNGNGIVWLKSGCVISSRGHRKYSSEPIHMHSICRYTSHHAQLAPGESVMAVLSPNDFMGRFWSRFSDLRCRGIKVAHSHVFPRYIDWCMNSRKKHGTRWVHTHHNWYYPEFGRNGIEPWQQEFNEGFRMAATEADVCLCVSRGQQRFFREQFGIRCFYLPNGVDVKACRRGSAENWVKTTGIRQGFVLFVGRNDPVKNPEFFVALAGAMPDRQFVIAGQGISEEVIETEWNLRIPRNLHVLGTLDHAEVQDAIAACSVLVLCSRREGLPTLVLEGMVAGKPVVVPDEEGCMEAIEDGRYGFIYQSGNLAECAARVIDAEADRAVRFLSQQHAVNMYAWPQILDRLDRIYDGESPRNIAGCL
jgi:glycosyltransferase involved in cell wall biosynthesis